MDQVLRGLEADEASANHHRPSRRPDELDPRIVVHAGEECRAPLDPLANGAHVGHGPHLEDAGQVDARNRRAHRERAGRQHQLVVGLPRHLAGRDVAQVHRLLPGRDRDRLALGPRVDRELRAKELLARHQQARLVLDHARDVIRQAAVRIRHERTALHHDDLGLFVQPAQARRARRAAGNSANDDDLHAPSFLPACPRGFGHHASLHRWRHQLNRSRACSGVRERSSPIDHFFAAAGSTVTATASV